jgi:anti-sigma regulatory factor (Ser/Thr protein kinase)
MSGTIFVGAMDPSRQYLVRFVADASELGELRRGIRELLAAAPSDLCCDVLLGVDEAVANALVHSRSKGTVSVHAAVDQVRVTVTVSDHGQGFDVAALVRSWPPASAAECGRGIYLLATLMDAVTVDVGGGTIVHMSRELAGDGRRMRPLSTALSPTRARFGRRPGSPAATPPDSPTRRESAGPQQQRLVS